jgi:hypothetical protein
MKTPKRPGLVATAALIAATDVTLRVFGMRRTLDLTRRFARTDRMPDASALPVATRTELVRETARLVARAAAFHPGRAQCLEQSIVLYLLLRRRGIHADLRIGVQPVPFSAHAWVEHDGRPINESEDFILRLTPFPGVGA